RCDGERTHRVPVDRRRRAGPSGDCRNPRRMSGWANRILGTAGLAGALGFCIALASAQGASSQERRSGFEFMSRESQDLQQDDTANPGMLWVLDGEALWNADAGESARS